MNAGLRTFWWVLRVIAIACVVLLGIFLLLAAPLALVIDTYFAPGWLTPQRATIVVALLALPLSFASMLIAYHIYRLQAKEKMDAWQENFRELHEKFWSDDKDFAIVRKWIACDSAYSQVRPILQKRLNDEPLTPEEYNSIEKIDRFCAIMLRVKQVNSAAQNLDPLTDWEMQSYFTWWFGRMLNSNGVEPKEDRKEFWHYIEKFWERLTTI